MPTIAAPGDRSQGRARAIPVGTAAAPADAPPLQRVGAAAAGPGPAPVGSTKAAPPPGASAPAQDMDAQPGDVAPAVAFEGVDLISTGISGLDAQYGGGLPNGSLILLTSEPTTATSIFCAQYAAAGLTAGDTVHYFSMERQAEDVRKDIAHYLDGPGPLARLILHDGFPHQFRDVAKSTREGLGISGGEDVLAGLEDLATDSAIRPPLRIIVESMTEMIEGYDEARVFRVMRLLHALVRAMPASAVLTMVAPLHTERTVTMAKHIADAVVEFHVERKGFGIYPYIAVTKMRGVAGSARLLLFKETDTGLWLESTKRVY